MRESRITKAMRAKVPTVLGLDIGGANLKAATAAGRAISVPFALWKQPDALPAALAALVKEFPDPGELAVTMTGELCDCFATKREGVNRILDAVEFAAAGRPIRVWGTGGNWLSVADARVRTLEVAASNWHALATFAGRYAPSGKGLLIDIGSTTTDIIPLENGVPVAKGKTDEERLRTGELVYVGVKRTPIMALGLPNICAEYFADTRDAGIILLDEQEDADADDTPDGRPATMENSYARMARMMGGDSETIDEKQITRLAVHCTRRLADIIAEGLKRVAPAELQTLILSGLGEWLGKRAFTGPYEGRVNCIVSLTSELGPEVSACAPAYAVAVLAFEMPA
jgi:probable H4MPT-linked C1 transfer pathway protein